VGDSRRLVQFGHTLPDVGGKARAAITHPGTLGNAADGTKFIERISRVQAADLVVVASPTYKATYSGLLKLFLDRFGAGSMTGTAVPVMLGAHWKHSLAPELLLKPVLVEIGATCPTAGLFLLDSEFEASDTLDEWMERARPQVTATTKGLA